MPGGTDDEAVFALILRLKLFSLLSNGV